MSLWRNRLARSAVNRKVGGSNPPRDDFLIFGYCSNSNFEEKSKFFLLYLFLYQSYNSIHFFSPEQNKNLLYYSSQF